MKLDRTQKSILKIYAWVLSVGLGYYLFVSLTGWALPCQIYATTGYLCAGCGITRMFVCLFRLDFRAAFFHNPLMFVLFFLWNVVAVLTFWGRPRLIRSRRFLFGTFWMSIAAMIFFWIFRNIH